MTRLAALALLLLTASCAPTADAPESKTLAAPTDLALPSAPGSLAPFLHVGPEGLLRAAWLDPLEGGGHALRVATHDGRGWTEPVSVASGPSLLANWADTPTLRDQGGDRLAVTWPVKRPAGGHSYDLAVAFSQDGGKTWSEAVTPHDDDTDTEHGFPALGPGSDTGLVLAWLDGRDYAAKDAASAAMTLRIAHVSATGEVEGEAVLDDRTCDCCPIAAVDSKKVFAIVYRDRSAEGELRDIAIVRREAGGWTEPTLIHADGWEIAGCPVNGPAVDAEGELVVVAWFTAADDEPAAWLSFSTDRGRRFSEPKRFDEGSPTGRVSVVLEGGEAALTWIENDRLLLRRVSPGAEPGPARELTELPPGRSAGMPRLVHWGEELAVAWTAPGRVQVARLAGPPR